MSENDQTAAGLPINSDPAEEKRVETPDQPEAAPVEQTVTETEQTVTETSPVEQSETDANPS